MFSSHDIFKGECRHCSFISVVITTNKQP